MRIDGQIHILSGTYGAKILKFSDSYAMMEKVEELNDKGALFLCFPGSLAIPKRKRSH